MECIRFCYGANGHCLIVIVKCDFYVFVSDDRGRDRAVRKRANTVPPKSCDGELVGTPIYTPKSGGILCENDNNYKLLQDRSTANIIFRKRQLPDYFQECWPLSCFFPGFVQIFIDNGLCASSSQYKLKKYQNPGIFQGFPDLTLSTTVNFAFPPKDKGGTRDRSPSVCHFPRFWGNDESYCSRLYQQTVKNTSPKRRQKPS